MRHQFTNPNPANRRRESLRILLTDHAWQRMTSRGIPAEALGVVLEYGRTVHARGAEICVIGRKEVEEYGRAGINLSNYMGIHVLFSRHGSVVTAYRNRDTLNLRTTRRSRPVRQRRKN